MSPTLAAVAGALERHARPVTFAQLKKAAGVGDAELKSALEEGVSSGVLFRWPDYKRSQWFGLESPSHAARRAVLAVAAEEALSKSALIRQARRRVPGFPEKAIDRTVAEALAAGELRTVGAFSAGKLLMRPGDVAAYAASARKFVEAKFRKAGFDVAEAPPVAMPTAAAAPARQPAPNAAEQILEAIRALQPVSGAPVSTQRLRQQLPALCKRDFDAAALELANHDQVSLGRHHDPHNLSQEERDRLIDGRDGTYYVAIASRG
jgi:hypothetical protein